MRFASYARIHVATTTNINTPFTHSSFCSSDNVQHYTPKRYACIVYYTLSARHVSHIIFANNTRRNVLGTESEHFGSSVFRCGARRSFYVMERARANEMHNIVRIIKHTRMCARVHTQPQRPRRCALIRGAGLRRWRNRSAGRNEHQLRSLARYMCKYSKWSCA